MVSLLLSFSAKEVQEVLLDQDFHLQEQNNQPVEYSRKQHDAIEPNISSLYRSTAEFIVEKDPWQFPKRTAKSRQSIEMSVETENRFNGLEQGLEDFVSSKDNAASEIVIPQRSLDRSLEYVERKRVQDPSEKSTTPKKTVRNIVPGELSWAEATAAKQHKTNVDRSSPRKQVTSSNAQQPASNITAEQEVFHVNLNGFATNPGEPSDPILKKSPQKDARSVTSRIQEPYENRRKPVITVVGDSIIRGIRKQEINRNVHQYNSFVKTFPGATTEDMESYVIPTLKRNPDVLIIHCGTNDLRKEDPGKIATKITRIAIQAKKSVRKVAVSSILPRGDSDPLERKRVQINTMLQKSLADNEIDLIKHEVFDRDWRYLLYDDGIHLNDDGTNVLGNNFVNYINNV